MKRLAFSSLLAVAAASMATPALAQSGCSRELLDGIGDSWVASVEAGTPFKMNLGEWVDYRENMKLGSMSAFFDTPRKVAWYLKVLDTTRCMVFVESVVLDEERPMVLATQLNNGYFGVGPINNIVSEAGDWLFDARATYEYARREDWSDIPEDKRNTREELVAAANAYLDRFKDPTVEVPWGTPCARLEGGAYTGKGQPDDSCDVGIPEGVELAKRSYVVDEVKGAVDVFLEFGERKLPDSHLFRIEDGRIRYVHTVTNCLGMENCGFPPFARMLEQNPDMQPQLAD